VTLLTSAPMTSLDAVSTCRVNWSPHRVSPYYTPHLEQPRYDDLVYLNNRDVIYGVARTVCAACRLTEGVVGTSRFVCREVLVVGFL